MDSLKDFVKKLNLPFKGDYKDDRYVINVNTSDDFSTLFNDVDLNKDLHLTGSSKATEDETVFRFTDGYYEVLLEANYDSDIYKCTIGEK